jgi:hypothetical protein
MESREGLDGTGRGGPILAIVFADGDGKAKEFRPVADSTLISYLGGQPWGSMHWLALDLADRNRVLMRFDPKLDGKVKKAELIIPISPDQLRNPSHPAPQRPFDVAIHEVTAAWDEAAATWDNQPAFAAKPAATVTFNPRTRQVRVDVTKLVERLGDKNSEHHGWLLKAAKPLPYEQP